MNLTKKSIAVIGVVLMSLVFSTGAFAYGTVKESGQTAVISQELTAVTELALKGISDFKIKKSDTSKITITGDQAFVDMVDVKSTGGYLYVESSTKYPVSVVITTASLESLILSKASAGTMEGDFNMDSFYLSLMNNSSLTASDVLTANIMTVHAGTKTNLDAEVLTRVLNVDSMYSSELTLSGKTEELNADFKEAVAFFNNLSVQNAEIVATGESTINAVFPGNSYAVVKASGDSEVSLDMNGILKANMQDDSTLEYTGHIEWINKIVEDDAEVSAL